MFSLPEVFMLTLVVLTEAEEETKTRLEGKSKGR